MPRVLLLAALLLPGAVLGQITGIPELDDLEQEFETLAYGNERQAIHHRHHGHHHLKHRPSLRHHKRALLFAEGPASVAIAPPQDELTAGRHPSVAEKLGHMEQQIHDLTGRKQAAAMARSRLEDDVNKAVFHMNEAVGIKRELARTEAAVRSEVVKLKKLEDDRLRLDRTHGHLVSSLHHIMEPKIQFAETRLKQKQHALHDLEEKAEKWEAEEKKFHTASLAVLEQRRLNKARYETAEETVKKARHDRDVAKKDLEAAKHSVAFNVEGYRFAQAHARAAASEEKRGEETLKDAKHSLKRLDGILNMEQRRVDESMALGKDRVQGKIRELETTKEKTQVKLAKLSKEYRAWQEQQKTWAREVSARKKVTRETSRDYAEHQQAVLDAAQAKVAYDAESDSDWAWDEWPTTRRRDTDEVDLSAD